MITSQPKRFSAGIVPFFKEEGDVLFLILRSYNYWDFPKGEVENGEDPFVAAKRELLEETKISAVAFPFGEVFKETPPYAQGKVARYYLGEVKSKHVVLGINAELGRAEHQEYRWVTFTDGKKVLGDRVGAILEWAQSIQQLK